MKCDKCGKENTPSEYCVWSDKLKKCIRYTSDITEGTPYVPIKQFKEE